MWDRFGVNPNKIEKLVSQSTEKYWVLDHKLSYDSTQEIERKQIVHCLRPNAYFVINTEWTVLTVLTEEMAMNNTKNGKWSKL